MDVLATESRGELLPPPLPDALVAAARRVARDQGLSPDWLNAAIGAQWTTGLPPSAGEDLIRLDFGGLHVALAGRRTLIALKLFAAVDQGRHSVHFQDLCALEPTERQLDEARDWVLQQDIADEFPRLVQEVCDHVRHRG